MCPVTVQKQVTETKTICVPRTVCKQVPVEVCVKVPVVVLLRAGGRVAVVAERGRLVASLSFRSAPCLPATRATPATRSSGGWAVFSH